MIVLNLECVAGHRFEGWFASVEAFDAQVGKEMVNCPHCQSSDVSRLPSGPRVVKFAPQKLSDDGELPRLAEFLRELANASEDVGDRFSEEARRIHYHETPSRQIRGTATPEQTIELIDEGIPILPVPPKVH